MAATWFVVFAALAAAAGADQTCELVDVALGTVTSNNQNVVNPLESPKHAFDNNINTKWMDYQGAQGNVWIEYTHPSPITVTQYSIVSANDASERDPSSWVLSGSNDGVYYVEIDRQTPKQPLFTERNQKRTFDLAQTSSFLRYRFLFLSVRDKAKANGLQMAEVELRVGSCTNACCGVQCASHSTCVDGQCVCPAGYSGSDCATKDLVWTFFTNRGFVSQPIAKANGMSLDECKTLCGEKHSATCAGVSLNPNGECTVHGGKGDLKSSANETAYVLVSKNLMSPITTVSRSPRETEVHTIKWDRQGKDAGTQMPSITVFRGETVMFEWVDRNSYFGYLTGRGSDDPGPTGRGRHGEDAPNHHSIVMFQNRIDFNRCDFRATSSRDLVGSYPFVRWIPQVEGTYFFGSSFKDLMHKDAKGNADPIDDCKNNLKMIVTVIRRPVA